MAVDKTDVIFEKILKRKIKIPQDLQNTLNYYNIEMPNSNLIVEETSESYYLDAIAELRSTPLSETFQELLFKFIDNSNLTDVEVYKKAFINRKLFSKIRTDKNYHPSFGTVTLLALALNLTIDEYEQLLNSASYSLSTNSRSAITIRYCFEHKIYDVLDANNLFYSVTDKEIKNL